MLEECNLPLVQIRRKNPQICFAQIYRVPMNSNWYEQRTLNITSQSLILNEQSLMKQYTCNYGCSKSSIHTF